ncbi:MAG: UDP-N-acetyl glucosamine 2-epimerase, partial [Calditrichaeota bacterium]|nr:UDP-N-acetyl glucosamine 2-epimerase [Calditrichota bacterium]
MRMKVFLVVGARPNVMKIAPIYRLMRAAPDAFEPIILHTGQHYDEKMSKVFFEDLELPRPDIYLDVGSGSHAQQTAEIMKRFEPELLQHRPDMVVVVGDVNSTIACALTTSKCRVKSESLAAFRQQLQRYVESASVDADLQPGHIRRTYSEEAPLIAHVEAGERSFDFSMPEEINRVTTDVLSDILFAASGDSEKHLLDEGADPRRVFHVGNIMIDALQSYMDKAASSAITETLGLSGKQYALVTLHRPANVDGPRTFGNIIAGLIEISNDLPVIFPMHPRTRQMLDQLDGDIRNRLDSSCVQIIEPVGYIDFLGLQKNAALVLTDSGGVQVE